MLRFRALAEKIELAYPGSEPWLIGPAHVHSQTHACNRIVAYPVQGPIVTPGIAGQGWNLEDLDPDVIAQIDSIDDIIAARKLQCVFHVWAPDDTKAENRLHALIVAVTDVLDASNITLDSLSEAWPQAVDLQITSGGCMVILTASITLFVLAGDINTVEADTATDIGEGTPTEAVTEATVTYQQETINQDGEAETETIYEETIEPEPEET